MFWLLVNLTLPSMFLGVGTGLQKNTYCSEFYDYESPLTLQALLSIQMRIAALRRQTMLRAINHHLAPTCTVYPHYAIIEI